MDAKELRIGNRIHTLGQSHNEKGEFLGWVNYEIKVDLEVLQNIITENDDFKYSAIPLTEDWLLKFGFVKDYFRINDQTVPEHFIEDDVWRFEDEIHLYCKDNVWYFMDEYDSLLSFKRKMKGVHDLQNLFFAIKGKELTLK